MVSQGEITKEISRLINAAAAPRGRHAQKKEEGEEEKVEDPRAHLLDYIPSQMDAGPIGPDGLEHAVAIEGNVPILFTVPHAGPAAPDLGFEKRAFGGRDRLAGEFTLTLAYLLDRFHGIRPHVLVNTLDRKYIDLNRAPRESGNQKAFEDASLQGYYDSYHEHILDTMESFTLSDDRRRTDPHRTGLHIAWHTFSHRSRKPYYEGDLYDYKNGFEEEFDPTQRVEVLPLEAQIQQAYPLILGTHLRRTIDTERAVDLQLQALFNEVPEENDSERLTSPSIPLYVPSRDDRFSLLGGKYEIEHALAFRNGDNHPIDSVQIEVASHFYLHAFDLLAWKAVNVVKKVLEQNYKR